MSLRLWVLVLESVMQRGNSWVSEADVTERRGSSAEGRVGDARREAQGGLILLPRREVIGN